MKFPHHFAVCSASTLACVLILAAVVGPVKAHEHSQTHRRLTIAAFELVKRSRPEIDFKRIDDLEPLEVEFELAQGAIDEDMCIIEDENGQLWQETANFFNHFFDPATGRNDMTNVPNWNPGWLDKDDNDIPTTNCDQEEFVPRTSYNRAGNLYERAKGLYGRNNSRGAYRVLGRVLHLMEDMTSQAHVHNDAHGHPLKLDCGNDIDDFEQWGWCAPDIPSYHHILDYFRYEGELIGSDFRLARVNSYAADSYYGAFTHYGFDIFQKPLDPPKLSKSAYKGGPTDGAGGRDLGRNYKAKKVQSYCDGEMPPEGFTCRLWEAMKRLYDGKPAIVVVRDGIANAPEPAAWHGPDRNPGDAFTRRVAEITYDFTSFRVHLSDKLDSAQPDSELNRMLRPRGGGGDDDCFLERNDIGGFCKEESSNIYLSDRWEIFGDHQWIGVTEARTKKVGEDESGNPIFRCINVDGFDNATFPDVSQHEEWWLNEHQCNVVPGLDPFPHADAGYAYIENIGGEGRSGTRRPRDSFIPLRYGCELGDVANGEHACGKGAGFFRWPGDQVDGDKTIFKKLYGTHSNQTDILPCPGKTDGNGACPNELRKGKTMLRIYGDVLYTTAVAHAAGLIETFVEEVNRPTAVAGGPYTGEACQAIEFDGSESFDQSDGNVVAYEWDFDGDGVFDVATESPITQHVYFEVSDTINVTLKVTDDDGFTAEDTTEVTVTEDKTPPNIENIVASPNLLWPPNHKFSNVQVYPNATDACGVPVCKIIDVISNEPHNGRGDGNTKTDYQITGDLSLRLRAERSGVNKGRLYSTTIQCTDANGNSSTGTADVTVQLSNKRQGRKISRRNRE